jgi:hypothetical protein
MSLLWRKGKMGTSVKETKPYNKGVHCLVGKKIYIAGEVCCQCTFLIGINPWTDGSVLSGLRPVKHYSLLFILIFNRVKYVLQEKIEIEKKN